VLDMTGLNDTFTVGIIFIFLIAAVFFYFYTRLTQVEKRMKLLETILLDLKVATESSFVGFPAPTKEVPETEPEPEAEAEIQTQAEIQAEAPEPEPEPELQTTEVEIKNIFEEIDSSTTKHITLTDDTIPTASAAQATNYDFQTLKELQAIAKQRGITGTSGMKRAALIDLLKQKDDLKTPVQPFSEEIVEEVTADNADDVFGQMAPVE
jgi:outer membrane biosynthesis protein TonB